MRSIRAKIITLLLCSVILSSAIIGFVCIRQTTSILRNTAKENMVLLCEKNARELNTVFDSIEVSIDTLAHYAEENLSSVSVLKNATSEEYEDYLAKISQVGVNHASSLKNVVAVYAIFDPEQYGTKGFFYLADEHGKLYSRPMSSLPPISQIENDWWYTPTQEKKSVWLENCVKGNDINKTRVFTYVVPIYYSGQLLGVVGMDFSYDLLYSLIEDVNLKDNGFASIFDRNGQIVAHPTLNEGTMLPQTNISENHFNITEEIIANHDAAFANGVYSIDAALSDELFPYIQNEEERMLTMCTLQNGMVLCLTAPSTEIYAEQTKMIETTIISIVIFAALATFAAVIFAGVLSAPIIALKKNARRFIAGDLETAVIPTSNDEIGELAQTLEKTRIQMKIYIDELYQEAHVDSLTGTHNKAAFQDAKQVINTEIANENTAFGIALFDVNYLKITNDTFGHIAGDELLQKVAACMKSNFGPQNVYRIGGDEFIALFPNGNDQENAECAKQCLADISNQALDNYPDVPISCAMGFAAFTIGDNSFEDVFARADKLMYKHKAEIKKNTPFWHEELQAIRRVQIERYLEFLNTLSQSMDSYPFLFDITTNTNWFYNYVNKQYAICKNDSPTNTIEDMMEIVHPDDRKALAEDLQKIADGVSNEHNMNYRWITRDGRTVWINCHGKVIKDSNGKPFLMIGRVSDTALASLYNPLTGLFNKAKFFEDGRNGVLPVFRRFALVNIDKLSHINLKYGKEQGDKALKLLADTLSKEFPGSTVYHLEKDHFALLLNMVKESKIRSHIEKIQSAVEDFFSISVAVLPNEKQYGLDADGLYEHARHLLKASKNESGGTISFFGKEDFTKTLANIELTDELEESVYQRGYEGFSLCYQPQIDARTHEVVSSEVLLRYTSPTKGNVPPIEFIPLLERTSLICEVGTWILKRAIAQCVQWRQKRPGMGVSVNISPVQLKDPYLADTVLTFLDSQALPANALTLELTESVELENAAYAENFDKLRKAGVHISIDDFGTGYANLGYLKKIQADELKIDRLFVKDLKQNSFHQNLIANIATFAKDNGLRLCAEGVETVTELAVLELNEPDLLQGYLFDKPIPAEEFEARYITPDEPKVWPFETELKKQRDQLQFAYLDMTTILSKIEIGLWTLQFDKKQACGKIYCDDISRKLFGIGSDLSPAQRFDYVIGQVHEKDQPYVLEMLQLIGDTERVEQFEFTWKHPAEGNVCVRVTGKFTEEKENGIVVFEGFVRILRDNNDETL